MNSEYNWAANVLLWEIISAGRFNLAIAFAMVKVFPEPVTPNNVLYFFPEETELTSSRIAFGWSPQGLYFEISLKSGMVKCLAGKLEDF